MFKVSRPNPKKKKKENPQEVSFQSSFLAKTRKRDREVQRAETKFVACIDAQENTQNIENSNKVAAPWSGPEELESKVRGMMTKTKIRRAKIKKIKKSTTIRIAANRLPRNIDRQTPSCLIFRRSRSKMTDHD